MKLVSDDVQNTYSFTNAMGFTALCLCQIFVVFRTPQNFINSKTYFGCLLN